MMKIINKILLLIMVFSLTGCSLEETGHFSDDEANQPVLSDFKIGFCDKETLNPFISTYKINRAVLSLCYDNIIKFDQSFKPYSDCVDYEFKGQTVYIKVKDELKFSDGSLVTTNDLKYSLDLASKNNSIFIDRFSFIKKYYIKNDSLIVEFNTNNENNILLLSIPCVKNDSSAKNLIGTGLYYYSLEDGNNYLRRNDYNKSDNNRFSKILLINIADKEDLTYNINYSLIDCSYTDFASISLNLSNNVDVFSFPTLKMYYLTLNKNKVYLSSSEISRAISLSIDRESLVQNTSGAIKSVWEPFINSWYRIPSNSINSNIYSIKDAFDIFQENGFNLNNGNLSWKKNDLTLNIVCDSDDTLKIKIAEAIAISLNNIGFKTNITYYSKNSIVNIIEKGDFDLYIGECNVPYNFDISFITSSDISIVNSINDNEKKIINEATSRFLAGEIDISEFIDIFNYIQPYIPLFYKNNAIIVDRRIVGSFNPTNDSPYFGLEKWQLDY